MASEEYLHFRDWRLSKRHREFYGTDCPMADIDMIVIAYDRAVPKALIEYKHSCRQIERLRETTGVQAVRSLADMAGLPAWVAYYNPRTFVYQIVPLNKQARDLFGNEELIELVEADYVSVLYKLRERELPEGIMARLNQGYGRIKEIDDFGPFVRRIPRKKVLPVAANLCRPKKRAQRQQ